MLKIAIGVLFALTSSFAIAQSDYYMLNDGQGCYVKEYVNKKFVDVPSTQFKAYKLRVIPNKKDPNTMFFKLNNRYYSTLKRCLRDANADLIDDQDLSSLQDSGDEIKQPEAIVENKSNQRKEVTAKDERKFYIELEVGSFSIADKNPAYPDWKKLEEYTLGGQPIKVNKIHKADYDSKFLLSLGGGRRISEILYGGFKFKYYKGKKEDKIDITAGGYSDTLSAKFEDQFISFLVGGKIIFLEKSQLRPFIGIYAGASSINSKIGEDKDKFESLSFSGQLEFGLEFFLKQNLALTASYSYEYLGRREFKEMKKNKDSTGFDAGESFTSKMDYSNSSILVGAKLYFN